MGAPVPTPYFSWTSFDVRRLLPPGWQENSKAVATAHSRARVLRPRSVTSREENSDLKIPVMTVNGAHVREAMPWLWDLYHHEFLDLAKQASGHDVFCATRDQIKVNLNVQVGRNMRYECHVDSNPLEGLLYLTTHPPGAGGELVVANHKGATSVEAVDADCTVIHPLAGNLVFFDARHHPHYVRSLRDDDSVRIVAAMNYYTEECDESKRPIDLDQHLFGESKEEATGA